MESIEQIRLMIGIAFSLFIAVNVILSTIFLCKSKKTVREGHLKIIINKLFFAMFIILLFAIWAILSSLIFDVGDLATYVNYGLLVILSTIGTFICVSIDNMAKMLGFSFKEN